MKEEKEIREERGEKKGCDFCGYGIDKSYGEGGREWKKCHEEERCFEKVFECRERKIVECREKR